MITTNDSGHLCLDGVDLVAMAEAHGTPLYVYGADSIRGAFAALRRALPAEMDIHFSVKANPSLAVCHVLRKAGARAEIASAGELALALAAGWSPEHIVFAGPGKSDTELAGAVDAGLGAVHAESLGEVERLAAIAATAGRVQPVCLRVNPNSAASEGARIVTGSGAQKFGIDVDRCGPVVDAVRSSDSLSLRGLHFFAGSQFGSHQQLLRSIDDSVAAARTLCTEHDVKPEVLDLGGGIGVSHRPEDAPFDVDALGLGLHERLGRWRKEERFAGTRFMMEPGRALVSEAGVYLARVLDEKVSDGRRFLILDGGIHHALLPITSNGYRTLNASRMEAPRDGVEDAYLGGPLCTSVDQWHSGVTMGHGAVGDVVAVLNSGAYGLSASMGLFLSHGWAAEVLLDGGADHLVRRRASPEDILATQQLPPRAD